MVKLSDTSAEAERVLVDVYRKMSAGKKWLILGSLYRDARALHAAGVLRRDPTATSDDIRESWLHVNLGVNLEARPGEPAMEQQAGNLRGLREVVRVFTDLGIAYALGGSMASSLHGVDRFTRDADITVEPFPGKESLLASRFGPDYYVSLPAIQEAVRERSSFNIINTATGFKVDVFVRRDSAFERTAMERRIALQLPDEPSQPIVLHTAEDVILFKLRWYRLGNEASDQQWTDVVGVLQVQLGRLDEAYLDHWATDLGVNDLLARARQAAST